MVIGILPAGNSSPIGDTIDTYANDLRSRIIGESGVRSIMGLRIRRRFTFSLNTMASLMSSMNTSKQSDFRPITLKLSRRCSHAMAYRLTVCGHLLRELMCSPPQETGMLGQLRIN